MNYLLDECCCCFKFQHERKQCLNVHSALRHHHIHILQHGVHLITKPKYVHKLQLSRSEDSSAAMETSLCPNLLIYFHDLQRKY